MTQQRKPKRNIKTTVIPLAIDMTNVLGIINFPSENFATTLEKPQIKLQNHKQQITFKSAVGRISDSDESDDQIVRKKTIPMHRVTIKPQNIKKKYFKVDIPVNKGTSGGVKNLREKTHFVIQFDHNNKGTITVVEDVFDCQMEIINAQKQLSFEEKMKLQDARLDSRRREQKVQILQEKKDGRKKQKQVKPSQNL